MVTAEPKLQESRKDQHRRIAREWKRRNSDFAVIEELPPVENRDRREMCRYDLLLFAQYYFPESTGLGPFSDDHVGMLDRMQHSIIHGGKDVNCVYREFAKTSCSVVAALWAIFYGHRRCGPVFSAEDRASKLIIDSWKMELMTNARLLADFPEIVYPVVILENKFQRTLNQQYQGELTHMRWKADLIRFATIPGSEASGAVLVARTILGAARGLVFKNPDGSNVRPDYIIIDDPQTDASAAQPLQCQKRKSIIDRGILRGGGHRKSVAATINCTVIEQGDLACQYLDPAMSPGWRGHVVKMVKSFSAKHEDLWLGTYRDIRLGYDREAPDDRLRAQRDSTDFYKSHREEMDDGCVVSWNTCFDRNTEISAIQHAYNILIDDGEDVFMGECQGEPKSIGDDDQFLAATVVRSKTINVPQRIAPIASTVITGFIDVQTDALYWVLVAWEPGFGGTVIDYGSWPEQSNRAYALKNIPRTLGMHYKSTDLEGWLYQGLTELIPRMLTPIEREDGNTADVAQVFIDSRWGQTTDTVRNVTRRQPPHVMSSYGVYCGASSEPLGEIRLNKSMKQGVIYGHHWETIVKDNQLLVRYDSNFWKSFIHRRFAIDTGASGALSLYEGTPTHHQMYADQIVAEYSVRVESKERSVDEWKERPNHPDNHFFDCTVGAAVAASYKGINLDGTTHRRPPKPKQQRAPIQIQGRDGGSFFLTAR